MFTELSTQTKVQLDIIIESEFGHIPIVNQDGLYRTGQSFTILKMKLQLFTM